MTRHKAAGLHLAISAVIAATVILVMLAIWYPGPLFTAMGGHTLVMILVGVDVVLGPMITLIVFNPSKPKHLMRFDLAVIGLVQLAALVYGVHVVHQVRPQYMVFTVDRFDLVSTADLTPEVLAKAPPAYREIHWGGPVTVAARQPTSGDRQMEIIMSASQGGRDLQHYPEFYVPYEQFARYALARAHPIAKMRRAHPEAAAEIDRAIAATGRPEAEVGYLPLKAKAHDYSVLVDGKTGAVLGFAKVNPW